jgi:hypothetical protein
MGSGNGLKKICDRLRVPHRCLDLQGGDATFRSLDHFGNAGRSSIFSACHGEKPDMTINLTRRTALIGLSTFVALPVHAQTAGEPTPDAVELVSLEQPAVFDITPITGTLKETVQKGQQLIWRGRGSPNDRRFQITNMSVAFLRSEPGGQVKMTFAGDISSLGYRPVDEAKLNVIVRTKGGASIYSWSFGISVRCADNNRPLGPLSQELPSNVAANVFINVGTVEIAEYREPNYPRVMVRRCPNA